MLDTPKKNEEVQIRLLFQFLINRFMAERSKDLVQEEGLWDSFSLSHSKVLWINNTTAVEVWHDVDQWLSK